MGNSLRRTSKTSSSASKIVNANSSARSTRSNDADEDTTNEREIQGIFETDSFDDDRDDLAKMSNWRQKFISTSRRRATAPTSDDDPELMENDIDKRASRNRSKSTGFQKLRGNKSNPNVIPKQAGNNPSSLRLRRSSESPAIGHKEQNGTSQGHSGPAGGSQLQLTMAQINLVRKLWQHVRVQGENGPGISILRQHLFFRCPAVREMFATDLEGVQSEMCYHKRLQTHAESLSELLDELVNNLERAHIVKEKLRTWGRLHANVRHIGFTSAFWDRFAESLNDCTLTWCQKAQRCFDAQVAWTTIVLYVTEQLKDGYYEECRRLRKEAYANERSHSHATSCDHGVPSRVTFADMEDFDQDLDSM